MFLGPSGSAQYHYRNRTLTGAMVDLSVPAILFHEEAKKTVRFNTKLYDSLDSVASSNIVSEKRLSLRSK